MTFDEWLEVGLAQRWCGPAVCSTHDGTPTSAAEDEEYDAGGDPCVHVVRLYRDAKTADDVERNHSPSVWRKR